MIRFLDNGSIALQKEENVISLDQQGRCVIVKGTLKSSYWSEYFYIETSEQERECTEEEFRSFLWKALNCFHSRLKKGM